MELMRNKTADVSDIRRKYDINEELDEIENEVIVEIFDSNAKTTETTQISSIAEEHYELISPNVSTSTVRILNPTLPPKIENKIRLDLLTCDLCGHKTSTINLMSRHIELHIDNKKLFECSECHKRFTTKRLLEDHKAIHTSSLERKKYECRDCGKFLSSQTAVNNHMKWFHMNRQFSCATCQKKFATVSEVVYGCISR